MTRALPFTKIVRWVWTWVTVFSPALHWMPSTGCPVAAALRLANLAPVGMGTVSGPAGVAGSATICNEAGIGVVLTSAAVLDAVALGDELVTAKMMTTITAMTPTAAPYLKVSRTLLARNSAARRSAAFRWSSVRRCALDCLALVIVRTI